MSHSKAHRYRLSKFDRPNSYTSTTLADLISSTTRSRDTYHIPTSVLNLSNEFAQPSPTLILILVYLHESCQFQISKYTSTSTSLSKSNSACDRTFIRAWFAYFVKYPQAPTMRQSDQMATLSVQRQLSPTPSYSPPIWIANRTHAYTDYGPTEKTAIQYLASHHHCTLTLFNLSFTLSIFCDDLKIEDEMLWYQVRNKFLSKDIS